MNPSVIDTPKHYALDAGERMQLAVTAPHTLHVTPPSGATPHGGAPSRRRVPASVAPRPLHNAR